MLSRLKNLRNQIDFFARSCIRFPRPIPPSMPVPKNEVQFQAEIAEFLNLLSWDTFLFERKKPWRIADVGAKNFSLSPLIDEMFLEKNLEVEIHGIEIDAFRRLSNFHTRADYGQYFASRARMANYHAIDFLDFSKPLDVILMLNPFVTPGPLQSWGLPLKHFRPGALFEHSKQLLKPQRGFLILSSPNEKEFQIASDLAKKADFSLGAPALWEPRANSIQKKPRFGRICYSIVENVSDSGKRGIV